MNVMKMWKKLQALYGILQKNVFLKMLRFFVSCLEKLSDNVIDPEDNEASKDEDYSLININKEMYIIYFLKLEK